MIQRLLTFQQAAAALGVPVASLRTAADDRGKTIRIGRALRLHPDDLMELVNECREKPKAPACTGGPTETHGKSATAAPACRPAQTAAQRLKAASRNTSNEKTGQVVRLNHQT